MKYLIVGLALGLLTVPTAVGLSSASAGQAHSCNGHAATIVGTSGDDILIGTSGPDVIVGLAGNDTISGLGGNDLICGDAGSDILLGSTGNDKLSGGRDEVVQTSYWRRSDFGDTLAGGPGNDVFSPGFEKGHHEEEGGLFNTATWHGDVVSFAGSAHGVHVDLAAGTATGQGHDRIIFPSQQRPHVQVIGSSRRDVLTGSRRMDWFDAGAGPDTVAGGGGNDVILEDAGSGSDIYRGGPGTDQFHTTDGRDILRGGSGANFYTLLQTTFSDSLTVRGGSGLDVVSTYLTGATDSYHLGAGRDSFSLFSTDGDTRPVSLDTALGQLSRGDGTSVVTGVEFWDLGASYAPVTITGSPEEENLYVFATTLVAHLGAGHDKMHTITTGTSDIWMGAGADKLHLDGVTGGPIHAYLGGGDDLVAAEPGAPNPPEILNGGAGTDTAHLGGSNIVCQGIETGCPS